MELTQVIRNQLRAAVYDCCDPLFAAELIESGEFQSALNFLVQDARSFAAKDPAAHGDVMLVLQGYTSFKAVVHYRLAHQILNAQLPLEFGCLTSVYANAISGRGKLLSGADIHPACRIGMRFILDHGYGTVIGETAELGDDVYMLGGVTLGATGISGNPSAKRHPIIGNRVQIGAFARILGRVVIGDDVFIGPHCVIKEDIPCGSIVTVKSQHQVVRDGQPLADLVLTVREKSGPRVPEYGGM